MRSSFSAAITSPLTWSSNVVHGAIGIGSRIIRSVRANCVVRVNEQEGYKKSSGEYLGVGAIRLTKLAKTIKDGLVHRGLQRQD